MKFQRIDGRVAQITAGSSSEQPSLTSRMLINVLNDNPPDEADPEKRGLPFQPRSYRDFMLFERHYYGVAMGLTSLYRPWVNNLARLYSATTGADFPLFKPRALWYRQPIFYQSNHLAFYADGAPIANPDYCEYLDVELELGIVLGKPLYNATPEEATAAIAGFCVFNDFSVRNGQMDELSSDFGPQNSKSFANSISATVVSADEILPKINHLSGRITINGIVVKEPKVDRWQFSIGEALAHVSKGTRLYPGEFFGSGTFPQGAGIECPRLSFFSPVSVLALGWAAIPYLSWAKTLTMAVFVIDTAFQLRVGDVVKLEIDGIGSVTNTIVAEGDK
ncbi:FAA hydrolase [Xylariaceae sp. FL0594]|nr:FAA hydrolase [Xylariaceae sp. FL0594]